MIPGVSAHGPSSSLSSDNLRESPRKHYFLTDNYSKGVRSINVRYPCSLSFLSADYLFAPKLFAISFLREREIFDDYLIFENIFYDLYRGRRSFSLMYIMIASLLLLRLTLKITENQRCVCTEIRTPFMNLDPSLELSRSL